MIAIKNATLVMRDHLIPKAVLFMEDGIITGFGEMRNTLVGTIEGDALKGKAKNPMGDSDFDATRA